MVRERGNVPGLLANADQRGRAMCAVTRGTALATGRRGQGRYHHYGYNEG